MTDQARSVASADAGTRLLPRLTRQILAVMGADDADSAGVRPGTRIVQDLGFDSISVVSLIFLCEDEFGVELSDRGNELLEIETAEQLAAFIAACGGT